VLPTAGELRLLEILWPIGEGTVEDLLEASGKNPPNYKTTQTLLRIMEEKKLVEPSAAGRASCSGLKSRGTGPPGVGRQPY